MLTEKSYRELRIRELREEAGVGLNATARKAGIGPARLSLIERGRINPTVQTLDKIADALGVDTAELVRRPTVAV